VSYTIAAPIRLVIAYFGGLLCKNNTCCKKTTVGSVGLRILTTCPKHFEKRVLSKFWRKQKLNFSVFRVGKNRRYIHRFLKIPDFLTF
jgi:hypothetical protein